MKFDVNYILIRKYCTFQPCSQLFTIIIFCITYINCKENFNRFICILFIIVSIIKVLFTDIFVKKKPQRIQKISLTNIIHSKKDILIGQFN